LHRILLKQTQQPISAYICRDINHYFFPISAVNDNQDLILSDEVSCEEVEKVDWCVNYFTAYSTYELIMSYYSLYLQLLKEKVEYGLTLNRFQNENNDDLELPSEIVESQNYVRHYDEAF